MQAIKERRSVRKYRPDPVSEEALNTVLEAARWAPSWANTQCWRFIVVRDRETKEQLADTLLSSRFPKNPAKDGVKNAPIVIVACAKRGRSGYYKGEVSTDKGDWYMYDIALAMQNLTLAAHAIGLGTVHIGLFDAKEMGRILSVPEDFEVVSLTPLGYPDEMPNAPPRKDKAEIVFQGKYGST
jgi:nitroreductase